MLALVRFHTLHALDVGLASQRDSDIRTTNTSYPTCHVVQPPSVLQPVLWHRRLDPFPFHLARCFILTNLDPALWVLVARLKASKVSD